jgi:V/A-type H+-transporting ATPase subunit I
MSRISVTGSKRVMDEAVEAVHDLNLLHVTDYDDTWEGFEPGDPVEGAEEAAEKLVTVRALQSTLDVDEDDAGRTRIIEDDELDAELEEVRQRVNELDDRRSSLRDERREIDEAVETARPFAELGIDLDLLGGYENLTAAVGEADPEELRRALVDADAVEEYELFEAGGYVAVFVYPEVDIQDVLVGAAFTQYDVPDLGDSDDATSPEAYIEELEHRRGQVESKLETVETELAEVKHDVAGFLLAAEEKLAIEVQKREAPLTFATTENAFVAEGWIPSERYSDLADSLRAAVGDHVELEELERAEYDEHGHAGEREEVGSEGRGGTSAGGEAVAADGGTAMSGGEPPVVQDNSGPVKPFEFLIEVINRPKYSELDPTFVLFLTFPVFFGFMIGDLGYGLLYMGLGYLLMSRFDSDGIRALGGIGLYAGFFTAVFGILYGEFFGLHQLGGILWDGHPPIHKGLQPHYIYYAYAWLLLSVIVGVFHLVLGRVFDFVNNLEHGFREAFMESGSWIILTLGVWWWVFTRTAMGPKPNFIYSVFGAEGMTNPATGEAIENVALPLGFNGFPVVELFTVPVVGTVSLQLLAIIVGLAMVIWVEGGIGLIESITQAFGHVVSYTRIAAVLLAKAGMALAVNLLVFGAYLHDGEFHLVYFAEASAVADAEAANEVIFGGLVNMEGPGMFILGLLFGVVVLVLGHVLVLILGITSAGLQAVRLEYVEFFGKFYDGGGKPYLPFGYEREYTTED